VYIDYFFMHYAGDGVTEINTNNEIQVYPNPFSASTQLILSPAVAMPCKLAIYDIMGRVVTEKDGINDKKVPIDRSGLINGIYFLKVTDRNNNTYMTRIVAE